MEYQKKDKTKENDNSKQSGSSEIMETEEE